MNFVKVLCFLFFVFIICLQSKAKSAPKENHFENYFQSFSSTFLEVLKPNSPFYKEPTEGYPVVGNFFKKESLKWDPTWTPFWIHEPISSQCNPENNKLSPSQYFSKCESQLHTGWNNFLFNTLGTVWLKFSPYDHPYIRPVLLQLPGVKLRGMLALKGDLRKRPLIILRGGIFSNSQDLYPERFLFLNYFEQTNFNVLFLESVSSFEYASRNSKMLLGGYDEGLQNFYIASQLSNSSESLNKIIDTIHLVAISHGGAGLFYAALLNDLNPKNNEKIISTFHAYCPLLDLKSTTNVFLSNKALALGNAFLNMNRLQKVKHLYPNLTMWNLMDKWLDLLTNDYTASQFQIPQHWRLPSDGEEKSVFWKKNDFRQHFPSIQSPVLVLATQNDPLVALEYNTGWLKENIKKQNIEIYIFKNGHHCSFPVAYKNSFITQIAQQHLLQNSRLTAKLNPHEIRFSRNIRSSRNKKSEGNLFLNIRYSIDLEKRTLISKIQWQKESLPRWLQSWFNFEEIFEIPIREFEQTWSEIQTLIDYSSVQSLLKRWVVANIKIKAEEDEVVFSWAE